MEIRPNIGEDIPEANMSGFLSKRKEAILSGLPEEQFLKEELIEFEFFPDRKINAEKYLFETDDNIVLEFAPAMYAFFALASSKARMREKRLEELLKTIEMLSIKNSKERVTKQKGEIRLTEKYKATREALYKISEIRRRCEIMVKAMEKKFEATRTKSANDRVEKTPGMWAHNS